VTNPDDRLIRCVSSVFPGLTDQEIRAADFEQLIQADSLAAVTLLALIEEEFGVEVGTDTLAELGSAQRICQYLQQACSNAALRGAGIR
jgi:acyl carrier protein